MDKQDKLDKLYLLAFIPTKSNLTTITFNNLSFLYIQNIRYVSIWTIDLSSLYQDNCSEKSISLNV